MVAWFIIVVSIANLFFGLIWSSKTAFNVLLKMYFILAFLFGGYVLAMKMPLQIAEVVQQEVVK